MNQINPYPFMTPTPYGCSIGMDTLNDLMDNIQEEINEGDKETMYKVGEIVISNGTQGVKDGTELQINQVFPNSWNNNVQMTQYTCRRKTKNGTWSRNVTYFFENQLCPATRDKKIERAKADRTRLEKEIKELDKKIDFLENYEDEEDYAASKIKDILDKKGDKDAIRKVLKEMKRTKIL